MTFMIPDGDRLHPTSETANPRRFRRAPERQDDNLGAPRERRSQQPSDGGVFARNRERSAKQSALQSGTNGPANECNGRRGATADAGVSPRLLVSVRDAAEARIALNGGAAIVDIKEPANGSLGRASSAVQAEVIKALTIENGDTIRSSRRVVVTAALGELLECETPEAFLPVAGVALYKLGLSSCNATNSWMACLDAWYQRIAGSGANLVAVAYADHAAAKAPAPQQVLDFAVRRRLPFFLIDTFVKGTGSLRDFLTTRELSCLIAHAHANGVAVALAGSLRRQDVAPMVELGADVLAVRGAACADGERRRGIDAGRVADLMRALTAAGRRVGTGCGDHSPPGPP